MSLINQYRDLSAKERQVPKPGPLVEELTHEDAQMLHTFRRIRERDEEANYLEKQLRKQNVAVKDAWEQYQTILNLAIIEEKKNASEEMAQMAEASSPGI